MKENTIHIDPIEHMVETHYFGKVSVNGLTFEFVLTEETTFFNSNHRVKVLWGEGGVDATIKDKILDLIDKEVELFIKSKSKK